ncbi:MAG: sulfite exporter TauE/SafE family protein [Gammaproteobacteria bacterium]|nr:sulfite exporter TauE/SafE family protein [Gammaproteobacteria bacterium]
MIFELLLSPAFAWVAAAVFLGGFMRGFVGFGGAVVSIPVLSIAFGPLTAVPIAAVMAFPALFQLLPDAIRYGDKHFIGPVSVGVLGAAPIGCLVLVSSDPYLMKIAISLLVLLTVALLARNWRLPGRLNPALLLGVGAVGGIIQGAAGMGGPPAVAMALARAGSATQQRGNVLGVMTTMSFSSLFPLWYFDLFTREAMLIGVILLPVYSGSAWLGARRFSQDGERYYRRVALGILAAIGTITLILATHDYLTIGGGATPR